MFSFKALIIGSIVVALGTGVTYLSYKAEQEELREEFELNKFNKEWSRSNDSQRLQLLERELEKLCSENPDGCKTNEGIKGLVNQKPDLKSIFNEKFTNTSGIGTNINETCKSILTQMKIKAFCPA